MQLVQRGLVDLNAPITRYLPMFPKELGIRVIDPLNYSSGLPNREDTHLVAYANHPLPPLEGILAEYLAQVDLLDFTPGTQSQYCNWNYLALGVLIERVTGKPYASYVAESILGPSGMGNTSFHHADLSPRTPLASPIIPTQREAALLAVLNENLPERDQ